MKRSSQAARGFALVAMVAGAGIACTVSNDNLPLGPTQDSGNQGGAGQPNTPRPDARIVEDVGGSSGGVAGMSSGGGGGSGGAAGGATQGGAAGQPTEDAGGRGGIAQPVDPVPPVSVPPAPDVPPAPPVNTPPATSFDFEQDTQGWKDLEARGSIISRSTVRAFTGESSLQVQLNFAPGDPVRQRYIGVPAELMPKLKAGSKVTYRVWVPASEGKAIANVQGFVQAKDSSPAGWVGMTRNIAGFMKVDGFLDIVVTLPANFNVNNLNMMGVQFSASEAGGQSTVYIDSVSFEIRDDVP